LRYRRYYLTWTVFGISFLMRLLTIEQDGGFSLTEFIGDDFPRYAILSHTWGEDHEEVTFKDIMENTGNVKPGYNKIRFCGERAASDDLRYFWVDTCCIDKSNSVELSEAINSMFRWYREAAKCYVYLPDVSTDGSIGNDQMSQQTWKAAFRQSRWFTRGWTLQELLAPTSVEFYSAEGELLGDRNSMGRDIQEITGISIRALEGSHLSGFSIDERLSWAARRKTKRKEDAAYSLLGIFDIQMPLIYGEGREKALSRLQREIAQSSQDKRSAYGSMNGSGQANSYHGPVFNGPISGRYVIPGPQVTGGTMNFNFGGDGSG
jgi:hypothetical protein